MAKKTKRITSEKQYPVSIPQTIRDHNLVMEYNGVFLEIITTAENLKVLEAYFTIGGSRYAPKPRIWFEDPYAGEFVLRLHKKGKVGMLADYLGMKRTDLYELVKNEDVDVINNLLQEQGTRKIKLTASLFEGDYYINTLATEKHTTIKFSEIQEVIIEHMPKYAEDIESGMYERSKFWEIPIAYFDIGKNQYDVFIRVMSGRNITTRAVKVILKLMVNNKKELTYSYDVVKHTKNWKDKFIQLLTDAEEMAFNLDEFVNELKATKVSKKWIESEVERLIVLSPIRSSDKKNYMRQFYKQQTQKFVIDNLLDFVVFIDETADKISVDRTTENTPTFFKNKAFEYIIYDLYKE